MFYGLLGWKLNPMFGAAAMSLSSVCVVSNALRLKLFKPKFPAASPAGREDSLETVTQKLEGEKNMKKTMIVEGMSCGHCSARVEKALNALEGVKATVDLESKTAAIETTGAVTDEQLKAAVVEAGYEVASLD